MTTTLEIIQGDDKQITISFGDADPVIQSVCFASGVCGICKNIAEKIDGEWVVTLSAEETANLPVGLTTFDICVTLIDGKKITSIYHGNLLVKKKDNR